MKAIIKFFKNLLWFCLVLFLIGVVGGICYGFYDYHNGNAEFYQRLYTQAQFWLINVKNEITGEEKVELLEVSPTKMPVMELSVEGTPWDDIDGNRNSVAYDENDQPVIFVYGKDMGGDLYFPYGLSAGESVKIAHLYTGNEWNMPVITEHVTVDTSTGTGIVAEEFLMGLEPGEYFISIEPMNEQGQTVGLHCLRLVVEEETTYISPQQGFASLGSDNGYLFNDLQNIQPITLSCYNLGDDRILKFQEISDGIGNQNLSKTIDSQYYEISEAGNSVTLKEEYLSGLSEYSMRRFQVTLASGKTINSGWHYLMTVDGGIDWLTVNGPDTYSISAGGDYVADIHMGWAVRFDAFHLIDQETQNMVIDERDTGTGDFPSIDEENRKVVISEDVMKTLGVGRKYDVVVKYQNGGTGFLAGYLGITIVP